MAAHNESVFIPENALDDPRVKVVPEAEEEKYQSLCAAPLTAKSGQVIGVISLHVEAPREFTRADSEFLVHAATLVAGAIENARLYQDTRRRLALVEGLSDLARAVSSASTLEELLPAVARHAQRLLEASCCYVLIADDEGGRLLPGAVWPVDATPPRSLNSNELGIELALSARAGTAAGGRRMAAALWGPDVEGRRAGGADGRCRRAGRRAGATAARPIGRIDAEQREIAGSIANQAAVAIKKVQLIDRLTERNAIKDLLEDLSHGTATAGELEQRAGSLGCDLQRGSPGAPGHAAPGPGRVELGVRWRSRSSWPRRAPSRARCSTAATLRCAA